MGRIRLPCGFSLVETLVAATLVAAALGALAHLAALAADASQRARVLTITTLLAESKAEELLGTPWDVLKRSDQSTLDRNVAGFYDVVDRIGRPAESEGGPASPAYVRRWSVEAMPGDAQQTARIQVVVLRAGSIRGRERARVLTITRRPHWWEPSP